MRASRSSPELRGGETDQSCMGSTQQSFMGSTASSAFMQQPAPPQEDSDVDPMMLASMSMNTRWYPHVSASRGTLKLSRPAALTASGDPGKEKEHQCPFFEAPKHRFADVKSLPGGKPTTPTKSMKWRSDIAWNDADNHSTLKVTHTLPKNMALTTRSATLRGATFG